MFVRVRVVPARSQRRSRRSRSIGVMTAGILLGSGLLPVVTASATEVLPPVVEAAPRAATDGPLSLGAALERAQSGGMRVEATAERTANDTTWANPDGTFYTRLSAEPVRWKTPDGQWQRIDQSLVETPSGSRRTASAAVSVELPARADQPVVVDTPNGQFRISRVGAVAGSVTKTPTGSRYTGVLGGADLLVEPVGEGVKDTLIVPSLLQAPLGGVSEVSIDVPEGVTARLVGGAVEFVDARQAVVAVYGSGFAYDAASAPGTAAAGAGDGAVPVEYQLVSQVGQRVAIMVSVPMPWLASPQRVWPVSIDPVFQSTGTSNTLDTFVENGLTSRQDTNPALRSGRNASGKFSRTFLRFTNMAPDPGKIVLSGGLAIGNVSSDSCTARTFFAYPLASTLFADAVWTAQPSIDPSAATATSLSFAKGASGCAPETVVFPITKLLDEWLTGARPNRGLALYSTETATTPGLRTFNGSETNAPPLIEYTWMLRPGVAVGIQASPGDTTANVRWSFEPQPGVSVSSWRVTAYGPNGARVGEQIVTDADARFMTYPGLDNGTTYTFKVAPRSGDTAGPESIASNPVTPSAATRPEPGERTEMPITELTPMTLPADGTAPMPAVADPARAAVGGSPELGLEDYQTYIGTGAGAQADARVNVANGNLVAQVTDSTPVPAHGRLSYTLRRTYNSQDIATPVGAGSSDIGAGWTLNLAEEAGDATALTTTANVLLGATGGPLDPSQVSTPGDILLVDRDGTRHTFTAKPLETSVASPLATEITAAPATTLDVARRTLAGSAGAAVCVDTTFTAPAGVHLSLYRYVQVGGGGAACPGSADPLPAGSVVLGYATVRPDRVRAEYAGTGQLISLTDAAGVEMRYVYENALQAGGPSNSTPLGRLTGVYETRGCGPMPASGQLPYNRCRAFRITYRDGGTTVQVVDPAFRSTFYKLSPAVGTTQTRYLMGVINPDGTLLQYTYQGVREGIAAAGPVINCGGSFGQLCSVIDGRGNITRVTYAPGASGGAQLPPTRVATLTDRRGLVQELQYGTSTTTVTSRPSTPVTGTVIHVQTFALIDSAGRVGRVLESSAAVGTTPARLHRDTVVQWDAPGSTCNQPQARVDHNRCRVERRQVSPVSAIASASPTQISLMAYNDVGQPISLRRSNGEASSAPGGGYNITTYGYRTQYVGPGGTRVYNDQIFGNGTVGSSSEPNGTRSGLGGVNPTTLYVLSDRVESLTPRGNAAGSAPSAWQPYRTTFRVDATSGVAAGTVPSAGVCTGAESSYNTGLVCEVQAPAWTASGPDAGKPSITRYTYDAYGQKTSMTTPKAIAETPSGSLPPSYRYTYFSDSSDALSGSLSAGGWLQGVTDPSGAFVAYGYDRAGNVVRTWDRNATEGRALSAFPGTLESPPNNRYREQLYGLTSDGREVAADERTRAIEQPWRYLQSDRDPLGNRSVMTYDANGNLTAVTSPRGTQLVASGQDSPPTFDTVMSYDAGDLRLTTTLPADRAVNGADRDRPTAVAYDAWGNATAVTDPRGVVTGMDYDAVNRPVATITTRGAYNRTNAALPISPLACRASTAADTRFHSSTQPARTLCTTTVRHSSLDTAYAVQDANGQVTSSTFDVLGRPVSQTSPRGGNNGLSSVTARATYDRDDRVLLSCAPRGSASACTTSNTFSRQSTYDVAGRLATTTTFQRLGGAGAVSPVVTTLGYDANGNATSSQDGRSGQLPTVTTFDQLDRAVSVRRPRSSSAAFTTTYGYDRVGNRTYATVPVSTGVGRSSTYSYDANNRLLDSVEGASSLNAADQSAGNVASADGGSNTRTRLLYDADGHTIASYSPRAFTASVSDPDERFMQRVDFDNNGRPIASYAPRADNSAAFNDATGSSGSEAGVQAAECPTGASPASVSVPAGMATPPGYPSGVGVCVTRTAYDPTGQPVTVTLPTAAGAAPGASARQMTMTWSDDRLLLEQRMPNPAGSGTVAMRTRYDAVGQPLAVTNAFGETDTTSYTPDRLVAQRNEQGYTRAVQAGEPDVLITHSTSLLYDADGNTVRTIDPLGRDSLATYEPNGLLASTADTDAGNRKTMSYGYDAAGNLTRLTNPNDAVTMYSWTQDSLLQNTIQPLGSGGKQRQTDWVYDDGGRKTSQTHSFVGGGATPKTQSFTYYPNSGLKAEVGYGGESITRTYDPAGNVTRIDDSQNPSARIDATYYLDNLPRTVTDGAGAAPAGAAETTAYAYNGSGAPVRRQQGPSGAAKLTAYRYNDAGLPTETRSELAPESASTPWTWSYDVLGRPSVETTPNGQRSTFAYQPDGSLVAKTTRRGALTTSPLVASWVYAYDNLTRQTVAEHTAMQTTGGEKQQRHTFGYDASGRLIDSVDDQGAHRATYDDANNRLTYTTVGAGLNGSPAESLTTYNDDDTVKTSNAGTPGAELLTHAYDVAGSLMRDGCYTYSYDGFDRMLSNAIDPASKACADAPSSANSTYTYDGLDRQRTKEQTTKTTTSQGYSDQARTPSVSSTSSTQRLHYDGLSGTITAEDGAGAGITAMRYTLDAAGENMALTTPKVGGTTRTEYLGDDGFGTVTTVTNDTASASTSGSSGFVSCATRFNSWGTALNDNTANIDNGTSGTYTGTAAPSSGATATGSPRNTGAGVGLVASPCATSRTDGTASTANDVFFRGARRDAGTGTYQMGSRTYDPAKAAFQTQDSYRQQPGAGSLALGSDPLTANRYAYVNGDPVNYSDPDGHRACSDQDRKEGCYEAGATRQQKVAAATRGHINRVIQNHRARVQQRAAGHAFRSSVDQARYTANAPQKEEAGWALNTFAGAGRGLWALGPGAVGDVAGLIPWEPAQSFSQGVEDTQLALQDWSGADPNSAQFRGANITVQVVGTVATGGGLGAARAGATGLRTAAVHAGDDVVEEVAGSIRHVNPTGAMDNCVACAIATDSRLAGAPATALPVGVQPISVLSRHFGGSWKNVAGRDEMTEILQAAGPGARGIVYGAPPVGSTVGHVFNAVNQGGVVRFLDGQAGRVANFKGYTGFKFLWTNQP